MLKNILFCAILILGFVLRTYTLSSIPSSLHIDEASIGYNAYSILTTGKDEHGISFPFYFQAFGEYKSPIQIYSTIPFIFLFGLNEFSVRLTSVLYGLLGIIAIYFLTKELLKENKHAETVALFAMFFLAISPWDIHFSRIAWEMMPFVFFTTFGLFLFLRALRTPKLLPVATIFFMLAFYSYLVACLFIPIFLLLLFTLYIRYFLSYKKETIISFLFLLLMLIPFFLQVSSIGLTRWQQVSIFSNPPKNQTIVHHITSNYLQHFSFSFLFTKGDSGMQGQPNTYDSVKGMGELYLFQLPLLLLGIYYVIKKKNKTSLLLVIWLLLYPLGSIFTDRPTPLARRSIIGVIPFQIVTAVGMSYFLQLIRKIKKFYFVILTTIIVIIGFSLFYYVKLYFISYPLYSSDYYGFQYGSKPIVQYFMSHEASYDDLIMSPYIFSPYIYFKFYAPNDCLKCRTGLPDNSFNSNRKQLFALPPYYIASHPEYRYTLIQNIYYPNGSLAFELAEIKKNRN